MSEVTKTLGAGALVNDYEAGDPTIRVSPAAWPAGVPFSSTPTFSVTIVSGPGPAYPVYTVSAVDDAGGGNFDLTIALESGTDGDAPAGSRVVEGLTSRALAALIAEGTGGGPGGIAGDVQLNDGSGGFAGVTLLPVIHGGTGDAAPSLVPGSGISITGDWPNQEVSATGGGGGGGGGFNPTTQTDVTATRSLGTVFQNTTDAPIFVFALGGGVAGHFLQFKSDSSNPPATIVSENFGEPAFGLASVSAIVLPGNFYSLAFDVGGGTLGLWVEWSGASGSPASYKYEWIPAAINQNASQLAVGFGVPATSAANLNQPVAGNQLFATGLIGQLTNFFFGRRIPDAWDSSDLTFDVDSIIDGGVGDATLTAYLGPVTPVSLANPVSWGTGVAVTVTAPNVAGSLVRFSFVLDSSTCSPGDFIFVAVLRGVDTFAGSLYPLGGLFGIKY